jgi:hypothetical protein
MPNKNNTKATSYMVVRKSSPCYLFCDLRKPKFAPIGREQIYYDALASLGGLRPHTTYLAYH